MGLPSNLVKESSPLDASSHRPAVPFDANAIAQTATFESPPNTARIPFNGSAGGIETPVEQTHVMSRANDDEPTRQDLLQRAVALGPFRMAWESIVLPSDPILGAKMQPRVAERRARFRRIVQVALGACLAACLVAAGITIFSPLPSATSTPSKTPAKAAPATGIVPVEKLEVVTRTKSPSHVTATARPTPTSKKRR